MHWRPSEPGSAILAVPVPPWLSSLRDIATRFPSVTFEVAGSASMDELTSAKVVARERAEVVMQMLIGAGISEKRVRHGGSRVMTDKHRVPDSGLQTVWVRVVGDKRQPSPLPAVGGPYELLYPTPER